MEQSSSIPANIPGVLANLPSPGWCLRQRWFSLRTEITAGTDRDFSFNLLLPLCSLYFPAGSDFRAAVASRMSKIRLDHDWSAFWGACGRTWAAATLWHSLAVPALPWDVTWGHISAVPDNGTEGSSLNYNGLSPQNKYLSACLCISSAAVQDLMQMLAALCTEPGPRADFTLSVLPKLPCGTKVYLADTWTSKSVNNIIFIQYLVSYNWLKFSYHVAIFSMSRTLSKIIFRIR